MTRERLLEAHRSAPFRPFTLHLADGRSFHVPHPEFLSVSPNGRTVVVHGLPDSMSILDLLLVTEIEMDPSSSAA